MLLSEESFEKVNCTADSTALKSDELSDMPPRPVADVSVDGAIEDERVKSVLERVPLRRGALRIRGLPSRLVSALVLPGRNRLRSRELTSRDSLRSVRDPLFRWSSVPPYDRRQLDAASSVFVARYVLDDPKE